MWITYGELAGGFTHTHTASHAQSSISGIIHTATHVHSAVVHVHLWFLGLVRELRFNPQYSRV